ncbi:MAG: acyl-CoA dehydrogenase family protein [Chloroflexi bacterium]|nr:acyl-CoA dehydrogenase family protein [Chloroflexota bacterium]
MYGECTSPLAFLQGRVDIGPLLEPLQAYTSWWQREGQQISESIDRMGTPWLRMFDRTGQRVDQVLFPPAYRSMLLEGYQAGVIWRAFSSGSLIPSYLLGYITGFYDTGLYCPYTVSLSTAVPLEKYGDAAVKAKFLPSLLRRDADVWQGATWMTEIKGGSDLGAAVETVATPAGSGWTLTGDKYFASNAGAELAVVAARPLSAPSGIRGLALFLVPRFRMNGELNYTVRRLKDKIATRSVPTGEVELRHSEAYLLGKLEWGIYLILEVLNISRVANSIGSVALAQRAFADALAYAQTRVAFGKPIMEHPLLKRQFQEHAQHLDEAFILAWEAVQLLNSVWRETPNYSDRYQLFRLVAHMAKYWTAEVAVQTAKWSMEVHGAVGVMAEYGIERWLREAMIVDIWEGTSHRQILDGMEVVERKQAHKLLFHHLAPVTEDRDLATVEDCVTEYLAIPSKEKREAMSEEIFRTLIQFTIQALLRGKHQKIDAKLAGNTP